MKFKLSYYIKSTLLLSILAFSLLMEAKNCFAAEAVSDLEGVKTLFENSVYEYDLNGDGKMEKLQYNINVDEDQHKTALKIYINDKLCLSR